MGTHQLAMLTVHSAPAVEPDSRSGWQITFWLGEAFDYAIPFRQSLDEMVTILSESAAVVIDLPPYVSGEDFVQGALRVGSQTLGIYYEYSLGFLSLTSATRATLENVASQLLPSVRVR